jgi:hypothetical protein
MCDCLKHRIYQPILGVCTHLQVLHPPRERGVLDLDLFILEFLLLEELSIFSLTRIDTVRNIEAG